MNVDQPALQTNVHKLASQHRRNQRREFKALCKREGWSFRKMWKDHRDAR